jgi:hypothetical protein
MRKDCKLTEEMIVSVRSATALGMPLYKIAKVINVTDVTLKSYIDKGEIDYNNGEDTLYAKMYRAATSGEGQFIFDNLTIINKAAQRDWKAAAWLLERRVPEYFALKQEVNASVEGVTIKNDLPKAEDVWQNSVSKIS